MMPGQNEGWRLNAIPRDGWKPESEDSESNAVELIESMAPFTIGILKAAKALHREGVSEHIAHAEIMDHADTLTFIKSLSEPIQRAFESYIRQVVAEYFDSHRETWEA